MKQESKQVLHSFTPGKITQQTLFPPFPLSPPSSINRSSTFLPLASSPLVRDESLRLATSIAILFSLDLGTPRHPHALPLASSALPRGSDPARSNPFPRSTHLAIMTLPLPSPHISILLHQRTDALPEPLAVSKTMHGPQQIIPQVRQEQKGILPCILKRQLLLVG